MTRLILVRHGQTDHNVERRLQGQVDIPLNQTGHEQAAQAAQAFADLEHVSAVFASPLGRAADTAQAIADALGVDVVTDPRFLERSFGQWEGLTRDEVRAQWPGEFAHWVGGHPVRGVGVESRTMVGERFAEGCRDILADTPTIGSAIVVSHGAAITLGITAMLGLEPDAFRGLHGIGNCHWSELTYATAEPPTGWMRLVSHNLPPQVRA